MRRLYTTLIAAFFAITTATGCTQEEKGQLETIVKQEEVIGNPKVDERNLKHEAIMQCGSAYKSCAQEKDQLWARCDPYHQGCWKSKYRNIREECIPQFRDCLDSAGANETDKLIITAADRDLEQQERALINLEYYFIK